MRPARMWQSGGEGLELCSWTRMLNESTHTHTQTHLRAGTKEDTMCFWVKVPFKAAANCVEGRGKQRSTK